MKAKLTHDVIPAFSRYAVDVYLEKMKTASPNARKLYSRMIELIMNDERENPHFLDVQDKYALPGGQEVEILDVWHTEWPDVKKEIERLYATPTPPHWCVLVRARNFLGEEVETIVGPEDLENVDLPPMPPEGWLRAAEEWDAIRRLFGF